MRTYIGPLLRRQKFPPSRVRERRRTNRSEEFRPDCDHRGDDSLRAILLLSATKVQIITTNLGRDGAGDDRERPQLSLVVCEAVARAELALIDVDQLKIERHARRPLTRRDQKPSSPWPPKAFVSGIRQAACAPQLDQGA